MKVLAGEAVVTPKMAQEFLDNVSVKRPLYKTVINDYIRDMKRGNWQLNGESLVISDKGNLLNGRHRCTASVKTGLPFRTILVTGIKENTFATIDCGKKRSDKDVVSGDHSVIYVNDYTPALRIFAIHNKKQILRTQGCSLRSQLEPNESLREYEDRIGIGRNLQRSVTHTKRILNKSTPRDYIIPCSALSLLHYFIMLDPNGGMDIADAFVKKVYSKYNIEYGDPIGAFRNTIDNCIRDDKAKDVRSTGEGLRLLFYAWGKFINGKDLVSNISLSYINKFIEYAPIKNDNLFIDNNEILQRKKT